MDDDQINTDLANDRYSISQNGSFVIFSDSSVATTIDNTVVWPTEFRNQAGDKITWSQKGPWKPSYVRTPKKTVRGEYETGKLYKRTHTVTIDNECMEEPQTVTVTEWATMDDIIKAKLGDEENGC